MEEVSEPRPDETRPDIQVYLEPHIYAIVLFIAFYTAVSSDEALVTAIGTRIMATPVRCGLLEGPSSRFFYTK